MVVCGGLRGWAVPGEGLGVAAWIALIPLVVAVRRESPGRAALLGVAFGAASLAIMHPWFLTLPGVNVFNTAALFGYLALYPAIWCAALAFLIRRKLPWVFSGAVLWVLLDWLRGRAGFLALPFDPLSYSQIMDLPLLQLAAFGGAPAIAFVVCATNLALARALEGRRMRPLAVPLALLAAVHGRGYIRLHFAAPGGDLAVSVIQPANGSMPRAAAFNTMRELTIQAAQAKPDLIVWPESAVRGFALQPSVAATVANVANVANTPILFGSADFGKYANEAGDRAEQIRFKNEAFLVFPDGTVHGPAVQNGLVPLPQYMPLDDFIEWPRWLVARQLHGIAGKHPEILDLSDGTTVAITISSENLSPYLPLRPPDTASPLT